MKITELRVLGDDDLRQHAAKMRREIFNLRFKGAVENIPQPHRLREMKRDIARSLTILSDRAKSKEAGK